MHVIPLFALLAIQNALLLLPQIESCKRAMQVLVRKYHPWLCRSAQFGPCSPLSYKCLSFSLRFCGHGSDTVQPDSGTGEGTAKVKSPINAAMHNSNGHYGRVTSSFQTVCWFQGWSMPSSICNSDGHSGRKMKLVAPTTLNLYVVRGSCRRCCLWSRNI